RARLAKIELVERQLVGTIGAGGGQVGERSGREIVDHVHRMTLGEQSIDECAPDEPGSAGDERLHESADGTRADLRLEPAAINSPSPTTVRAASVARSPHDAPGPTTE